MSSTVQKGAAATPAQFSDLGPDAGVGGGQEMSLNLILDVAVSLSLEVGRAKMPVRALLQLAPGAIVELDRKAGEPLDVLAVSYTHLDQRFIGVINSSPFRISMLYSTAFACGAAILLGAVYFACLLYTSRCV